MKQFIFLFILFVSVQNFLTAQTPEVLKVTTYKLDNGLTVFLNPDKTSSRVFGAVMVNAGAKNELPTATGMAHYLEHMLFKGTEEFGTSDFELEKVHLDSISMLYEQLGKATDEKARAAIQEKINIQSIKASAYGLPNEFDKMLQTIGSTEINAFTNYEMTFYHNSFPANELEKWLQLYAGRFRNPVFRSFQSELEVVYEEKNRASDNFERRVFTELQKQLFPNVPYGQWDVLGKTEHLKNPPLTEMYAFYNRNYKAGNMALILSGNFNADEARGFIAQYFNDLPAGKPTPLQLPPPTPLKGEKVVKKRITPIKVGLLAFQTVPYAHEDRVALDVAEYLLSNNSETGLINRLMTNNDLIFAGGFSQVYNDAASYTVFYVPKILVQSLKSAQKQVETQLSKVIEGQFTDEQLQMAKNDLTVEFSTQLESVDERGVMIGEAFNRGMNWDEFVNYPQHIQQVDREAVKRVAARYFGKDRLKFLSRTGFPKKDKLKKPGYKPVVTDQAKESAYYTRFKQKESLPIAPRFVDYQKDVAHATLKGGHQVLAAHNPVNDLFQLNIMYRVGRLDNPRLTEGADLMMFSGAGKYSLADFKEQFAILGINYNVNLLRDHLSVSLSGLEKNMAAGVDLIALLLSDAKATQQSLDVYVNQEKANRKLERKTPSSMASILNSYALYGDKSFYKERLDLASLKKLNPQQEINKIKEVANTYAADITYSGTMDAGKLSDMLQEKLSLCITCRSTTNLWIAERASKENEILFVDDKKARQTQIYFHVNGNVYNESDYPYIEAFNEYFGGGFSGLTLQEIREYRSLAYSTGGGYVMPGVKGYNGRLWGYIGCQADKTNDAIPVMVDLINKLPQKADRMESLRKAMQMQMVTNFPDHRQMPGTVLRAQRLGYQEDPNRQALEVYRKLNMEDLTGFWQRNIEGKPMTIVVYGDKRKIDMKALATYGKIREIDAKEIASF